VHGLWLLLVGWLFNTRSTVWVILTHSRTLRTSHVRPIDPLKEIFYDFYDVLEASTCQRFKPITRQGWELHGLIPGKTARVILTHCEFVIVHACSTQEIVLLSLNRCSTIVGDQAVYYLFQSHIVTYLRRHYVEKAHVFFRRVFTCEIMCRHCFQMQSQIMQAKARYQTEIHRTILSFSNIWIYIKVQYSRKYIKVGQLWTL